jgi:hypothetical protein
MNQAAYERCPLPWFGAEWPCVAKADVTFNPRTARIPYGQRIYRRTEIVEENLAHFRFGQISQDDSFNGFTLGEVIAKFVLGAVRLVKEMIGHARSDRDVSDAP